MAQSNLDDCKKEIRSVLLPYQRGCNLIEFIRAYKEFIGNKLPFRNYGFSDEIRFLYSMPDVVKVTPMSRGDYHLQAVADENTKHIQKMVVKQKPPKGKVMARSFRPSGSYVIPPRFTENINRHIDQTPRRITMSSVQQPKVEYKPPIKSRLKEPLLQYKTYQKQAVRLPPKASPQDEVIALVQHFGNKLALDDVLCEYKRMYEKELLLSKYGYSSIKDCLEDIPELCVKNINNCAFVVYGSKPYDAFAENNDYPHTTQLSTSHREADENNDPSFNTCAGRNENDGGAFIPDLFKRKLKMVAEKYKKMRASEFPSCFEKVTGSPLDLFSLDFKCLADLIDAVPDIFTRTSIAGSRNDYAIFVATEYKHDENASNTSYYPSSFLGAPLIDKIVLNIRNILQAHSEGIEVAEFSNIYSINCQDALNVEDFGFGDLETFLKSIKSQVPLTIDSLEGVKVVRLVYGDTDDLVNEKIPDEAFFPNMKISFQSFPSDFDFSMYIPVYVSSVASPGHLYIQLQGEDTADEMIKISTEMEKFYNGSQSELYKMKQTHIKVGATCVAKWPSDNYWYRAEITSIPSADTVSVFYVDYGTRDTISTKLLRYIKKNYVYLPAQAIRCRLAFLKPARNEAKWSMESRSRILNLCEDTSLMAKVEVRAADGVYSIVLCNTNGEEDVYINDVLRNEGLAEYDVVGEPAVDSSAAIKSPSPVEHYDLNSFQALQAKYCLLAFATIAPCFAKHRSYLDLMNEFHKLFPLPDFTTQGSIPMPSAIASGPPGFNTIPPDLYAHSIASTCIPPPQFQASQDFNQRLTISSAPAPNESEPLTTPRTPAYSPDENSGIENEIFDDDDDEVFQQFCQRLYAKKRYVKKVSFGDGNKIHVIVVESVPYASSGDVSHLIWNNKEADYLCRRMQFKNADIPALKIYETGYEELFQQLERYSVKGVQKTTGCKASILLFPLKVVIKILNIFGHPSIIVRTKLTEEIESFDPNDPIWMNVSSESAESDEEDYAGATDDDKIEKLCMSDLLTMKESIILRKQNMLRLFSQRSGAGDQRNETDNQRNETGDQRNETGDQRNETSEEVKKLEQLLQKVLQRIQEIKEICNLFA